MDLSWQDLAAAIGLVLVFEGLPAAIVPEKARLSYATLSRQSPKILRRVGLGSMILGAVIVSVVR